MQKSKQMEYFSLYRQECLQCKALVGQLGTNTKRPKCHYANGNKECPASEVRIIVTGRLERMAKALQVARATNNVSRQLSILNAVSKMDKAHRRTFNRIMER